MHNQNMATRQCCQNCMSCDEEFKQVINLKNSGLLIYLHNKDSLIPMQKKNIKSKRSIILLNSGYKDLKRFDYIAELCQYKIRCFKCMALLKYIRCLMDNLSSINKNEVVGICEYCKALPKKDKCKRCEYLMYKFLNNKAKQDLQNKIRFNELISSMRRAFLSLTQGQIICKHNIHLDSESQMERDKLLKLLNWSVTSTKPNIGHLFDFIDKRTDIIDFIDKRTDIIDDDEKLSDIITKIKSENLQDPPLEDEEALSESKSACVCKYLLDDAIKASLFENNKPLAERQNRILSPKFHEPKKEKSSGNIIKKLPQLITTPSASPKLKQITQKPVLSIDKNKFNIDIKNKNSTKQKEKRTKLFLDPDKDLILSMMKQRKKKKVEMANNSLHIKNEKQSEILESLEVETVKPKTEIEPVKSESVVECVEAHPSHIVEMIKVNKIVHCERPTREYTKKLPVIIQSQEDDLKLPKLDNNKPFSDHSVAQDNKSKPVLQPVSIEMVMNKVFLENDGSGVIFYQLSNREFIDKGWTKLPTTKIMRKMNIYKMIPTYTKFDWFRNHKDKKILFYQSSEKLAEIHENGCGKWFYKSGNLALEYYSTPELNSEKRCIVYGSDDDLKRKKLINILACFDYLGNGIVYDNMGNIRIKFNQSEGVVIDKKIGPPGRWKWHALNEPPVLYPVFFNTFLKEPYHENLKNSVNIAKGSDEMIHIELDNLRREKAAKVLQEYKSFQIRIKVVKINDYFTLRIISQAKIYLQFRCERMCLKLNLGLLLKNEEILDTDIAEVYKVSTPYDYPETLLSER